MERLTTNKDVSEMNMVELAHNCCYAKDGKARYRDYETDIDARELTRQFLKKFADGDDAFTCDEEFDECILDNLQYGTDIMEGVIAVFYRNLWAMADLREMLKSYEDAEEKGLLQQLPCNVGDVIYDINHSSIIELTVIGFRFGRMSNESDNMFQRDEWCVECEGNGGVIHASIPFSKFGKIVFLTREQAEQALKDMEGKQHG